MTLIQKSVTINAPVENVLAILEDPERQSELNPNLKLLSSRPSPLGFFDTTWEYTMAGIKFSGESTVIIYERRSNVTILARMSSGTPSGMGYPPLRSHARSH